MPMKGAVVNASYPPLEISEISRLSSSEVSRHLLDDLTDLIIEHVGMAFSNMPRSRVITPEVIAHFARELYAYVPTKESRLSRFYRTFQECGGESFFGSEICTSSNSIVSLEKTTNSPTYEVTGNSMADKREESMVQRAQPGAEKIFTEVAVQTFDKLTQGGFQETPIESLQVSLEWTLTHWNPSRVVGCCPFHDYCRVAEGIVNNFMSSPCCPTWGPLTGWQCDCCRCLNHEDLEFCSFCHHRRKSKAKRERGRREEATTMSQGSHRQPQAATGSHRHS